MTRAEDLLSKWKAKAPIWKYVGFEISRNREPDNFNEQRESLPLWENGGVQPFVSSSSSSSSLFSNTDTELHYCQSDLKWSHCQRTPTVLLWRCIFDERTEHIAFLVTSLLQKSQLAFFLIEFCFYFNCTWRCSLNWCDKKMGGGRLYYIMLLTSGS